MPADPADDANLPPELQALKAEAERRLTEWATTGQSLVSSSLYEAAAFYSTGLGDHHTHDAQTRLLRLRLQRRHLAAAACGSIPTIYFADPADRLAPDAETVLLLANPVQPHSEGEIVLASADPADHPDIRMNYYADPHDMKVMVAALRRDPRHRRALARRTPARPDCSCRPALAAKHGHAPGDTPSDALLEDIALHYSFTVYHLDQRPAGSGNVVDPRLRVLGVANLRVADASVMPNVVSGNTNAACIMIGEKAAELLAADHGVHLTAMVGSGT